MPVKYWWGKRVENNRKLRSPLPPLPPLLPPWNCKERKSKSSSLRVNTGRWVLEAAGRTCAGVLSEEMRSVPRVAIPSELRPLPRNQRDRRVWAGHRVPVGPSPGRLCLAPAVRLCSCPPPPTPTPTSSRTCWPPAVWGVVAPLPPPSLSPAHGTVLWLPGLCHGGCTENTTPHNAAENATGAELEM